MHRLLNVEADKVVKVSSETIAAVAIPKPVSVAVAVAIAREISWKLLR